MAKQLQQQTLLALLLCFPLCLVSQKPSNSSLNLIQNGSFEDGVFNFTIGGNDEFIGNYSKPDSLPGWKITRGDIDHAKGRWQPASDCSPSCIDLNGGGPATLIASFRVTKANYAHTLVFDTAANPDSPSPINGTFNITLLSAQNEPLNSSTILLSGNFHGYNTISIGWRTHTLFFTSPVTLQGNLTLSFFSNFQGWYGPLIDNVRIFEGLQFFDSERDAACNNDIPAASPTTLLPNQVKKPKIALILASVMASALLIILCIGLSIWKKRKQRNSRDMEAVSFLEGRLRVFPYSVVKAATRNFHPDCKLGQGTFGAVYKGIFEDGSEVAIKQLFSTTSQGQEEFLNEAMLISAVQHRNLVLLKGCCARGPERFLVCEYVENKSLHQVLWGKEGGSIHLDWPKRFQIALGTARGLAYLHESSQPRIIHRDIKAGNILLDRKFEAKIADFGLAKWFPDDKTHVSTRIAGTLGYLAPEYALKGQLTEKADVFSFGIVVLELVSGRKNLDYRLPLEKQYLLDWARILWRQGKMKYLIDPEMDADSFLEEIERVIRVGLWCTQGVATIRPTMSEAISMLQGLPGQNEEGFTFSRDFNALHIEESEHPLLLNDLASSFSRSNFTADTTTSSGFSSSN